MRSMPIGWDGSNAYCMSEDGKNCWNSQTPPCSDKINAVRAGKKRITPLVCGKALKAATGVTGYESATHWCSQAQAFFKKPLEHCKAKGQVYSYAKKACVTGKGGGSKCTQHSECASKHCVFTCPQDGLCA